MRAVTLLTTMTLVAVLGVQASAQSLPGVRHEGSTVSLAFNFHNNDEDEPYSENYTTQLTATSRYSFRNSFGAAVMLGYSKETFQEEFYTERYILDLNPYYDFGAGSVGLYYSAIARKKFDEAAYGVTGTFNYNSFGVEAYAGVYEDDGFFLEDTYGLGVSYDVAPDASLYASYRRDFFDSNSWNGLSSLGVTYDLASTTGFPISITGEVGRFTSSGNAFGDSEWNQFSIMASYSLGDDATSIFRGMRAVDYFYD